MEFTLRPFNFIEFLAALDQQELSQRLQTFTPQNPFSETVHIQTIHLLKTYLTLGGLPEVVMAFKNQQDFMRILANIFAFYKRDFESKVGDKLTAIFNQTFLRIAAATGSPIKNTSIIKSSSPGYKKVPDVLALLEDWHQIIKVEIESSALSKIGSITPKRYLFDHGIRTLQDPARVSSLDLTDPQNLSRQEVDGLIENFVLTELVSLNQPLAPKAWAKTHQSGLVDFIFVKDQTVFAIEVKASLRFNWKSVSGLRSYREYYPASVALLVNLDRGGIYPEKEGRTYNIPAYALYPFLKSFEDL